MKEQVTMPAFEYNQKIAEKQPMKTQSGTRSRCPLDQVPLLHIQSLLLRTQEQRKARNKIMKKSSPWYKKYTSSIRRLMMNKLTCTEARKRTQSLITERNNR